MSGTDKSKTLPSPDAKLWITGMDGVSAPDVLKEAAGREISHLYILASTPTFYGFVLYNNGAILPVGGRDALDASDVFELRCFCGAFDVRWIREGDNKGRATTLSEGKLCDASLEFKDLLKRSDNYLLWGRAREQNGGSLRLFEHRVGELATPIEDSLKKGGRAWLCFEEYFKPDEYGVMVWFAERLTGLCTDAQSPGEAR